MYTITNGLSFSTGGNVYVDSGFKRILPASQHAV